MAERKAARRARLIQLFTNIRLDSVPNVRATIIRPVGAASGSSSSSTDDSTVEIVHGGIFPDFVDALEWPIIENLYETDVPISEMNTRFEEYQNNNEIGTLIAEWQARVEGHMAELLRKGRVSDGLPKEVAEPTLPVAESAPNPLRHLSDDQKMLYRADSFFEPIKGTPLSPACLFDKVVSSGYLFNYKGSMRPVKGSFDVTAVKRNADAQAAARILLAALGKPDASFLEMKCPEQGYSCGRCHDSSTKTWEEMVCFLAIV